MSATFDLILAKRLYTKRREKMIKQQDLAFSLGITQQAYSKLERGETHFSDEIIDKVCNTLEMTIGEFVAFGDNVLFSNSPQSNNNGYVNDVKIIETLQKTYEQNTELLKLVLTEKDLRIKQLEELLNKK